MKSLVTGFNVKTAVLGSLLASLFASALTISIPSYAGEEGKACKHGDKNHHTLNHHDMNHNSGGDVGHKHQRHLMQSLDLTETQQATLKTQRQTQAEARQQLREQLRTAKEALKVAVNSGASESQLQALAADLGKLEGQAALERAKSHQAFLAVLTPEQQQKLEQLKTEHEGKMKERIERHKTYRNRSES
jgi:Spy/CpxP family protein refolding chaperone